MILVPNTIISIAKDDTIGGGNNIVAGATVNITKIGGGVASIYSDPMGTSLISLPNATDSNGEFNFFIQKGEYNYIVDGVSRRVDVIGAVNDGDVVQSWASISSVLPSSAGQLFTLAQHTSGGIGGGTLMAFVGSVTDDGYYKKDALGGFYLQRIATDAAHEDSSVSNTLDFHEIKSLDCDLSAQCGDGKSIVIAGDSLSVGAFDWPISLYQLGYAYDNSAGLMSWPQMLRDFIQMSDVNFIACDNVAYTKTGTGYVDINAISQYYFPFQNRIARIRGYANTDVVRAVVTRKTASSIMRIYCANSGASQAIHAGKVDVRVAGHPYATFVNKGTITTGGRTKFLELEPFTHDIGDSWAGSLPVILEFYNFRKVDDSPPDANGVQVIVGGFGEKRTSVNLTGRGGYTSAQVLAEVSTMITAYTPDVLFLIIGANDRATGVTSATVISNLTAIVADVRAVKPSCDIVFMTTTKASATGFAPTDIVSGETMLKWLANIQVAITQLGCRYVDTYNLFNNVPASVWRFDAIHFTKIGGQMFFNYLVDRFFGASIANKYIELFNPLPEHNFNSGTTYNAGIAINPGSQEYTFDLATLTYGLVSLTGPSAVIKSVTRVSAYEVSVVSNYPIRLPSGDGIGTGMTTVTISMVFKGLLTTVFPLVTVASSTENSINFYIMDILPPVPTTITDAQNDTKSYIVSWS